MLALYRKYRPKTLSEVVGQDQVTKPLEAALKSGKISHSYLFTGPRGCGKTSVARILAHEINGFKYELEDNYLDIVEIDAASNTGVDNIRDLREKAVIAPSEGKFKVYIIDEVHMLSKSAFNALLKTLEEPPAHVVFILATTDLEKVPITITSRSQVFTFRLADAETMLTHLKAICDKEGIKIADSALKLICEKGGGSFRDSLSLLDQISSLADGKTEISEQTVADCLGLPMDSKLDALLETYAAGDFAAVSDTLKSLLSEGLKPESLASACLNKIIAHPTPALLPLLKELLSVSAPYPEAKLLLAFLSGSEGSFASSKENSRNFRTDLKEEQSMSGSEDSFGAYKRNSRISDDVHERARSMAGATRSASRSARLDGGGNTTEFPKPQKTSTEPPVTLTPALDAQLKKCIVKDDGTTVHIYPPKKIIKSILERQNNAEILQSAFGKPFLVHEIDELPENSPEIKQISDIMGGVQEVNNNGGIPF
ncbi:DNA polymerase III subunit gamma/tau [Candidatus Saccharibacteria bacterium]|nr:DNA polymerase III subunit gamma/tau [Candidatus Saccharibacteria bacterium]